MDDLDFGTRDKRGHWRPSEPLEGVAPIYAMPPQPMKVLRWLPEYLFPWNVLFALSAVAYWYLFVPPVEVLQTLAWGWVLKFLFINAVGVFLFYGAFELRLYLKRAQENRFKYNPTFPADKENDVFWFNSQVKESILRSFLSGVPIWTGFQVLMLWAYANGIGTWVSFSDHPVWLFVSMLLVPLIHEAHFFAIHRLNHVPALYKWVHSVHHNSINPSPWSSLSMHTVEHLLYFGVVLWQFLLPTNPIIAIFALHRASYGAIPGHIGFDKIELGGDRAMDTHAYAHYLHHKYFEVNYGDGLVPFDALFGTWHDGTPDGDRMMKERFKQKKARARTDGNGATPAE